MASFAEINANSTVSMFNESTKQYFNTMSTYNNTRGNHDNLQCGYEKYIRNKIVFECLCSCVKDSSFELSEKLEDIIENVQLQQFVDMGDEQRLLGVQADTEELTYFEAGILKNALYKKLWERHREIKQKFFEITSKELDMYTKNIDTKKTATNNAALSKKDQTLILFKNKLSDEQTFFKENIDKRLGILEEILEIRLSALPKLCAQAEQIFESKIDGNYLKSRISLIKVKQNIFLEVPEALKAYQELLKNIKQQQEECESIIKFQLKEKKVQYCNVAGKEFDEILKSYLMYKASIDKLNSMCS